jgi:hypothetical protein
MVKSQHLVEIAEEKKDGSNKSGDGFGKNEENMMANVV